MDLFCGQYFLHLNGPIEQFNMHKELSKVFCLGQINQWVSGLSHVFSTTFDRFTDFHKYENEIIFI